MWFLWGVECTPSCWQTHCPALRPVLRAGTERPILCWKWQWHCGAIETQKPEIGEPTLNYKLTVDSQLDFPGKTVKRVSVPYGHLSCQSREVQLQTHSPNLATVKFERSQGVQRVLSVPGGTWRYDYKEIWWQPMSEYVRALKYTVRFYEGLDWSFCMDLIMPAPPNGGRSICLEEKSTSRSPAGSSYSWHPVGEVEKDIGIWTGMKWVWISLASLVGLVWQRGYVSNLGLGPWTKQILLLVVSWGSLSFLDSQSLENSGHEWA